MRLIERIPPKLQKISRFIVVGVISNGFGYGVYLLITWLGVPYKIAMTLLYCVGVTMSYIGNRKFTFASTQKLHQTLVKFIVAYVIGYALQYAILYILVDVFLIFHAYAQLCGAIVVAVYLFVALRYFVFVEPIPKTN
jgi:putative flippase GtrA